MSTGSQTLPADFAIVIRTQSDMGSQTPLYKKKEGKLRLKLSLKCQILENELEQMKERIFYVLFLFYFNAMSASLEKDKQFLNGLPVEIKATNQDPSSLPPAPPVLIIEKDRKEYELLEGVIQRLTAERDESKTSLSALARQYGNFDKVGSNGLGAFGSCPIPDVNFLFILFFFNRPKGRQ